jgi:transposase
LSRSLSSFRRYLYREVREVDPQRVVVWRPEPEPGEQAEIDLGVLGRWTDPATGLRRRLWAFVMVLGASRHQFVRPVWLLDLKTWIQCHVEAFAFFGAVPRRLVVDNLKDGMVRASLYDPKLNRTYAELAEHYRTLVDPCRSRRPTDKPVVERSLPYVHADRGVRRAIPTAGQRGRTRETSSGTPAPEPCWNAGYRFPTV